MTALQDILTAYRRIALTEREKGTYFEELILCYLKNEAAYKDLYSDVWMYADWARLQGLDAHDAGIDLVAQVTGTDEFHAIQCKLYAEGHRLQKKDIDSFFTASGKKIFTHRIIVSTTNDWSAHAEDALRDQQPPVSKIDLHDLENSQIDWAQYAPFTGQGSPPPLKPKKSLRPHQEQALVAICEKMAGQNEWNEAERGKLIMACGTGKTFTSLKIAEELAGRGGRVLFLVPSLALLSQTLTEWTQESSVPLHSFAVCSDSDVGKKRPKKSDANEDVVQTFTHELRFPATTHAKSLAREMARRHDTAHISVVFSTYHSIETIHRAQHEFGLADFDLIICDEAHRTTGATLGDKDESHFVKVHDADYIRARKRLYMTATPRIYAPPAKITAEKGNIALCSMDDAALYGETLYAINFSDAVKQGLLVDYKVIVLAVDQKHVSSRLQNLLKDTDNQIKVDDAARIVGCWKALSKQGLTKEDNEEGDIADDPIAMQRAVAFCQVIERVKEAKTHKISSKHIARMFQEVVESYKAYEWQELQKEAQELGENIDPDIAKAFTMICTADHVDGSMNASQKEEKLVWLKAEASENECRILSNVRCLSEGVDVPALDAVLFLSPRNSQVEVVQSVGRVMRNAPGKKRGYVILPVVIPFDTETHEALDDNKTYRVVWQVLQALRSHDDRFDSMINKFELAGIRPSTMEVIAVSDNLPKTTKTKHHDPAHTGRGTTDIGTIPALPRPKKPEHLMLFEVGELERAIYAKIVKKCGNRLHWEEWAHDIARIALTHISRITSILESTNNVREREAFFGFANELRSDLNEALSDSEIIEMLAQHLITKPVFDALFGEYSFASKNPISKAMQDVLDVLQKHQLENEADTLKRFYDSVTERAEGITNAKGRQRIVLELYEKFFQKAFLTMTKRLGIVYTPVEVVDFIIHSINDVLKKEFGHSLGSDDVDILDPFTGTGTFITRLIQSGLLTKKELQKKYQKHIHANEIVLLAYYIAAINVESAYHDIMGGEYTPFEGICLTDTFQMNEKNKRLDLRELLLEDNTKRRKRQQQLDIRVIMSNPPYSIGQESANDNAQNIDYPLLNTRIENTYAEKSHAALSKGLYDSYIRAIRWASDRIGNSGVLGFVTNAGFIDANATDGMRKCLAEEFSNIYIVHLRGNIRKNMLTQGRAGEGGNVFGSASMAGIAISILVKNPACKKYGNILFYDIGDYLSREEKLAKLASLISIKGITQNALWQSIIPNAHGDWINQREDYFESFMPLGNKRSAAQKIFANYSLGIATNRDAWCYNPSKNALTDNMERMIAFYNAEVERFNALYGKLNTSNRETQVHKFIDTDPINISWTVNLKQELTRNRFFEFEKASLMQSIYRPFFKQWVYFNRVFNERVLQMPHIFPYTGAKNIVITVNANYSGYGNIVYIADSLPDLHVNGDAQCFPLYLYEGKTPNGNGYKNGNGKKNDNGNGYKNGNDNSNGQKALLSEEASADAPQYTRRDAITDEGLAHFKVAYPGEDIAKEDIFYYVYGLLHSEDYRSRYANNLSKELPRIPCVKDKNGGALHFWAFSKAGRELADLHIGYEMAESYPATVTITKGKGTTDIDDKTLYRVEKMRYGKKGKDKDRTTVHYNSFITVYGIPERAYNYIVNGKAAIDWVVERQRVKTDTASGIVNDANDWANDTMGNAKYPLELLLRVITVSLRTLDVVEGLPGLEIQTAE